MGLLQSSPEGGPSPQATAVNLFYDGPGTGTVEVPVAEGKDHICLKESRSLNN